MAQYIQADQVLAQVNDLIRNNKKEESLENIAQFLHQKRAKHWNHALEQ
jgi:hypothetical protein